MSRTLHEGQTQRDVAYTNARNSCVNPFVWTLMDARKGLEKANVPSKEFYSGIESRESNGCRNSTRKKERRSFILGQA